MLSPGIRETVELDRRDRPNHQPLQVYKAEDAKLQRPVALKFLRSDVLEDEESWKLCEPPFLSIGLMSFPITDDRNLALGGNFTVEEFHDLVAAWVSI